MDPVRLKTLHCQAAAKGTQPRGINPSAAARYLSDVLPAESLILDCGCDEGPDAIYLTGRGLRVLAIDDTNEPLTLRFDAVMDVFTLPRVTEDRAVYLEQLGRAVRPGGRAVFEFQADDCACRHSLLACFEGWRIEKAAHTTELTEFGEGAVEYVVFQKPLTRS